MSAAVSYERVQDHLQVLKLEAALSDLDVVPCGIATSAKSGCVASRPTLNSRASRHPARWGASTSTTSTRLESYSRQPFAVLNLRRLNESGMWEDCNRGSIAPAFRQEGQSYSK